MSKLWIARDIDGSLYGHFNKKPSKYLWGCWYSGPGHCSYKFDDKLFPEVLWEDKNPTEVELVAKSIQNKTSTNSIWVARNRNNHLYAYIGLKPWKFVGYQWFNGNSFKIEDKLFPQITWDDEEPIEVELVIKKKITMEETKFKTGQEVLVRINKDYPWKYDLYSHYDNIKNYFCTISGYWKDCIPFKGNEHLVGTTNSPIEDLPIGIPVMCAHEKGIWVFGHYKGNNNVAILRSDDIGLNNAIYYNLKYIIPVKDFDFENPKNSLKYNIVK